MAGGNGTNYLVESALLTHGLFSLDNAAIKAIWGGSDAQIAYVECGKISITGIDTYLDFRSRAADYPRIDCDTLPSALEKGLSGALTASGTMAVCAKMSIPIAVTAGMGGVGQITGEELCPDLPALVAHPVTLVATAPKDMLDYPASFGWLRQQGVPVYGVGSSHCDGFMFVHEEPAKLDGLYKGQKVSKGMLLLKGISPDNRLAENSWLEEAIATGEDEAKKGNYFHPAVNRKLDELSKGKSSRSQLQSLLANAYCAAQIA